MRGAGIRGFHTPGPPWSISAKMKRNLNQMVMVFDGVMGEMGVGINLA